jgi:hypothetical protein
LASSDTGRARPRPRGSPRLTERIGRSDVEDDFTSDEERRGINWRKVMAIFLIFLLIGSAVIFFVLYAISLL